MNIISQLKEFDKIVEIHPCEKIILDNAYYKMQLDGTSSKMYLREGVWKQLQRVADNLPRQYALYIFDTYRSLITQKALFQYMYDYIKKHEPELNEEKLLNKTREFVADPFNLEIRHKLSHPTGGAVDLGLFDLNKNEIVNMGTLFDDPTEQSSTHYFENYHDSPQKDFHIVRMILYQTMINAEFTNYSKEWWHFDLGDYSWANKKNVPWHYNLIEKLP